MTTLYQRNFTETFPFSDTNFTMLLAASTALSYTVPGSANTIYRAMFSISSSADAWVRLNATAAIPSSNTATTETYEERILPGMCRYVKGGDTLSFISSGTPSISVQLLQVQTT